MTQPEQDRPSADTLILRFDGREGDGSEVHELRAAHVAEALQGLVGLSSDFAKAGAFGNGPVDAEVLVRPAREGSFLLEVVRIIHDNKDYLAVAGLPTLGQVVWWSTRAARADVSDFEYLENGNVKVTWQDNTAQEIPGAAWSELQKRGRRRKKQLRQIMAPLSDERVTSVDLVSQPAADAEQAAKPETFTLTRPDYQAMRLDDETSEHDRLFETEAQMSAIDFDDTTRWRVKTTREGTRAATVEDKDFLDRIARGLAIRKTDIFRLTVREHTVEKNGRTRSAWAVLKVESHRRAAGDGDR